MKTRLIIVAAPSGAGKSSFVEKLAAENSQLRDIVTFTTRKMRKGESQGQPYHFLTTDDFRAKIDQGFFIEWAQVHTNLYGTSEESLLNAWSEGQVAIMDIDVQGVLTFKALYPDVKTVFIVPPSIEELRRRVIKRDGKVPEDIEVRMANAEKELAQADQFDFKVVNDHFEESYAQFKKIVEELLKNR